MKGNSTGFLKPFLLICGAVILIIALFFAVAGLMGGDKNLGDSVDFTAEDAAGQAQTLSKLYGEKGVALIFFDRTQGDGKALLTNLAVAAEGKAVTTVLVAIGDSGKYITDYLDEAGLTADIIIPDKKGEIAALYNVTTCPITYFIATDGSVRGVSLSNLTPSAAAKYFGYIESHKEVLP